MRRLRSATRGQQHQPVGLHGLFSAHLPVAAGAAYTAEAYIRRTDTNLNGASLYIKYYDSANAEIGTFSRSSSASTNVWDYVSITGTAPVSAVRARVLCYSLSTSTGTMYFDGVSFRPTTSTPPANQIARYVSPSGTGDGSEAVNPARYNDGTFWDLVRTNLAANPVKVTFLTGEYLINTNTDCLLITNLGNANNLLTLEGQHPFGSVFTRNNSAQTAAANDPTASGRLQMVILKWVTNVVVRHLHWENDTTQANKLAGYSLVVQSGATGPATENVVIEGCSFVGLGPNYYGATGFHHAMTHNGRLSDCEFIGRGYDSHFHFSYNSYGAHDLRFERNYFQDCSGPYLRLRAGCHDVVLPGTNSSPLPALTIGRSWSWPHSTTLIPATRPGVTALTSPIISSIFWRLAPRRVFLPACRFASSTRALIPTVARGHLEIPAEHKLCEHPFRGLPPGQKSCAASQLRPELWRANGHRR